MQSRYTEARKAATSAVKKSKEKSWEEFGRRLDSNCFSANKVFWQTIRRLRGKRSSITYSIKDSDGNILTDENEILSRWREYFEDLLNPVKASTRDTHEVTHLGEDEVFTAAEVATAIKGIKSGKAAGEDEIRPQKLQNQIPKLSRTFLGYFPELLQDYLQFFLQVFKFNFDYYSFIHLLFRASD